MPRDDWKKARDRDHSKRAGREYASAGSTAYDYVWGDGSGNPRTQFDGILTSAPKEIGIEAKVRRCLARLDGPLADAKEAREELRRLGPKDKAAVPVLIVAFRDRSLRIREAAVEILSQIGKPAVPALMEVVQCGPLPERDIAASALGRIGRPACLQVMSLLGHAAESTREAATTAMARMGAAGTPFLWQALTNKNGQVRVSARQALIRSGSEAVPFLLERLEVERLELALLAIQLLESIGPAAARAVPILQEIAKTADSFNVQRAAAKAWRAIRREKNQMSHASDTPLGITRAMPLSAPIKSNSKQTAIKAPGRRNKKRKRPK